jgi:uncharacterized protein (DUF1501 family)
MTDFSRRDVLIGAGIFGCCGLLGFPAMSFASADTDRRLMVVILRGAMDGLAAVPAIGDASYRGARGDLALPDSQLLPLDGHFAMNAAAPQLHALYQAQQLLILHAAATPYRERSHFEAQDLLENGSAVPHGLQTGWLGRTVDALGGRVQGLAIGPTVPLVLQGAHNIQSWAPSNLREVGDADFMRRVEMMYRNDPVLSGALAEGQAMQRQADASGAMGDKGEGAGKAQFAGMMKTAAAFMSQPSGARIGTIDLTGWDTHAGQGTTQGRFTQVLGTLSAGIDAFRAGMGPAWNDTAVLMMTEFGRTVHGNGTGGSDHGTASAAFLAGGSVKGGRVIGNWPGLAPDQLYQNRDLYPDNDLRSLVKAVLTQHLALPGDTVDTAIFPQSTGVAPFPGLFA